MLRPAISNIDYLGRDVKCRILLSDKANSDFRNRLYGGREKITICNFTKTLSVGAESFHVDGRTCWHDAAKRRLSRLCLDAWSTLFEINLNLLECLPLWFIMAIVSAGITEGSPLFRWELSRFSEEWLYVFRKASVQISVAAVHYEPSFSLSVLHYVDKTLTLPKDLKFCFFGQTFFPYFPLLCHHLLTV